MIDDFGFSTAPVIKQNSKAEDMYNAILPLLKNLLKDAETSDNILWPNRKKQIEEFILKIRKIKDS
jgi:hypothetical protein